MTLFWYTMAKRLGSTILDTNFYSNMAARYKCRQVSAIVSHALARPFTRLMPENCAKKLDRVIPALFFHFHVMKRSTLNIVINIKSRK